MPLDFHGDGRDVASVRADEMVNPLYVIDKYEKCAANPEFIL